MAALPNAVLYVASGVLGFSWRISLRLDLPRPSFYAFPTWGAVVVKQKIPDRITETAWIRIMLVVFLAAMVAVLWYVLTGK